MNLRRTSAAAFGSMAVCLLCSCASAPPTRFYEVATAPLQPMTATPRAELLVEEVVVPESLNRTEIIVQMAETEFQVLDGQRWLSPLDDQLARALFVGLQSALPDVWVTQRRAAGSVAKRYTLHVAIQTMTLSTKSVDLVAVWTISGDRSIPGRPGGAVIHVPVATPAFEAIPPAVSIATQRLASEIASTLSALVP